MSWRPLAAFMTPPAVETVERPRLRHRIQQLLLKTRLPEVFAALRIEPAAMVRAPSCASISPELTTWSAEIATDRPTM